MENIFVVFEITHSRKKDWKNLRCIGLMEECKEFIKKQDKSKKYKIISYNDWDPE